jgi:uncharacterized protein YdeI (YjbR/CyaY-like superfamily)
MKIENLLIVKNKDEWRAWLEAHHASDKEVWLVYFKPASGRKSIDYEGSVDEALCYGWIDSLINRIDEERYARKFNPRRAGSTWSASNKERMEKLIASGRMTPAGLAVYDPGAKESSDDYAQGIRRGEVSIPEEFTKAIKKNAKAWAFFTQLPPSQQRQAMSWVAAAKKEETRQKRLKEIIDTFAQGKRLGLK